MKKRIYGMLLAAAMLLSLAGCGKSSEVKAAEKAIKEIGTVTLDSKEAIDKADELYKNLPEEEKEDVSNAEDLTAASEEYKALIDAELAPFLEDVQALSTAMDEIDVAACYELMDKIEADLDAMNPGVRELALAASTTEDGTNLVDSFGSMKENLQQACINNTKLAAPQYVLTINNKGSWLVNDHGNFAAYNTWCYTESDAEAAFEEYKGYVEKYKTIENESRYTFTFEDEAGNEVKVLITEAGDNYLLQVRVPRF